MGWMDGGEGAKKRRRQMVREEGKRAAVGRVDGGG